MEPYITPAEYMDKWLKMINYPIVSVQINNDGTRTQVDVSQRRYVFPKKDQDEDDGYDNEKIKNQTLTVKLT